MDVLTVAAVCFRDGDGRVLTVRKRGTDAFMLPGGKLEPGESPRACAVREIDEELGVALDPEELQLVVAWRGPAANEPDTDIDSTVYSTDRRVNPVAAAEIAELRWIDPAAHAGQNVAPMLALYLFPELRRLDAVR
ncbi:NUDIX domain-containing protein [Tsukamurella sp. 8F]|uniref:NUDIX hydrolase n=1 Tax=unclassified Tsukamurella TaxID=2633480 RepID=UPI0023B9465B|nr:MULTISPECIES: NUDIX domain-containing protein [unclassified Tsukamurella]MDF0531490.1 NUDIX domain-containing protein [Tsukamurella sp. 8J]MDF0588734.1 NUDIX domain-containing protein [Tsukamurella sp. 8F]